MELLIDLTGRVGGDKTDWQPGDVVVACPDGWPWSEAERKNPKWMIVKCPEMSQEEADSLMAEELPKSLSTDKSLLQRRQFKVDIAALTATVDVAKAVPLTEIRAVATLKEALPIVPVDFPVKK